MREHIFPLVRREKMLRDEDLLGTHQQQVCFQDYWWCLKKVSRGLILRVQRLDSAWPKARLGKYRMER